MMTEALLEPNPPTGDTVLSLGLHPSAIDLSRNENGAPDRASFAAVPRLARRRQRSMRQAFQREVASAGHQLDVLML